MARTEEIYIKDLSTDEIITVDVGADDTVSVADGISGISGSLPLHVNAATLDDSLQATGVIKVNPSDPRYALALQEYLPDGFLVDGAKVSGKSVAWGDLVRLGLRIGNRQFA